MMLESVGCSGAARSFLLVSELSMLYFDVGKMKAVPFCFWSGRGMMCFSVREGLELGRSPGR